MKGIKYILTFFSILFLIDANCQLRIKEGTNFTLENNTSMIVNNNVQSIIIDSNANFINNGKVFLQDSINIYEHPGYPISGNGFEQSKIIVNNDSSGLKPGNLGLQFSAFTSGVDTVSITRKHSSMIVGSTSSIARSFSVSQTSNSILIAEELSYDSTEIALSDTLFNAINFDGNYAVFWGRNNFPNKKVDQLNDTITKENISLFPISFEYYSPSPMRVCTGESETLTYVIDGILNPTDSFSSYLSTPDGNYYLQPSFDTSLINNQFLTFEFPENYTPSPDYLIKIKLLDHPFYIQHNFIVDSLPEPVITNLNSIYCKDASPIGFNTFPSLTTVNGNGIFNDSLYFSTLNPGVNYLYLDGVNQYGCHGYDTVSFYIQDTPLAPTISSFGGYLVSSYSNNNQWYGASGLLSGETNQQYQPNQNGIYTVEYTDMYGCKSMSQPYNVDFVGLIESSDIDLTIFPNPTSQTLSIQSSQMPIDHIKIFDNSGKVVFSKKIQSAHQPSLIQVSQLEQGSYILQVNNKYNKRFLKTND